MLAVGMTRLVAGYSDGGPEDASRRDRCGRQPGIISFCELVVKEERAKEGREREDESDAERE